MPYYYLISEVPDSTDEPIYDIRNYKKPDTYNLLLPSIHASREDNILDTGAAAEEAVRNLQASCKGSGSWPSSEYSDTAETTTKNSACDQSLMDFEPMKDTANDLSIGQEHISLCDTFPKAPMSAKYRPPFWAYDSIRPDLMEAARSLFYERKRQQAMYAGVSPWGHPSGAPRFPTDYELFAAWASLPRSDKLSYVSEVSGSYSPNMVPSDSLSTQRAVTSLLSSCPDSCSWPSFQFSRLQAQQRPHTPHHHSRHYHQHHHHYPQPPIMPNPLPFKLD